jgi:upstream activation factor subunit UAF30
VRLAIFADVIPTVREGPGARVGLRRTFLARRPPESLVTLGMTFGEDTAGEQEREREASNSHCRMMEGTAVPIKDKKESKQRAIKSPQTSGNTTRGAVGGVVIPTPQLAHIVGSKPLSRGDAMKRLWDYIKQHNLQDPQNKRMINADENLRVIFDGRDQLSMFEMTAYVSRHLLSN